LLGRVFAVLLFLLESRAKSGNGMNKGGYLFAALATEGISFQNFAASVGVVRPR